MTASDVEVMLDAVADRGIVKLDAAGRVERWSAGAQNLFGYSDAEVLGAPVSMLLTEEERAAGAAESELAAARESDRVEFEGWRVRRGGHRFKAGVVISAIRDQGGSVTGFIEVMRDLVGDRQRTHPMFYDLLESAPDAMVIVGPDGRIAVVNAQTDRMFGHPRDELIGCEVEVLLPERYRSAHLGRRQGFLADPMLRPMGRGLELWGLRYDGTEFPVDISLSPLRIEGTPYVSAAIRDVTDRRADEQRLKIAHEELERLARIDSLTGLANHAETISRLEAALQDRRIPGSHHLGVLFCDTDRFKVINDTWGHAVGDVVLSTLAARIRNCVRDGDTVGRIGGDEMLVLLPNVRNIDDVVNIAEKIRRHVAEPIDHGGLAIHATMSIGATLAQPGESVPEMTARADSAMYTSKQTGRNTVTTV